MNFEEISERISNLDPENIGFWPLPIRAGLWALALIISGFAVYHFMLKDTLRELSATQAEEISEKESFKAKASDAANLEALKLQMTELDRTFGALLRQLPEDTEVPGLLEDMTQLGVDAGLEFEFISLGEEVEEEFYAEQPIEIKVKGGYHSLGNFVGGVAALPRIVTLHDYLIVPAGGDTSLLNMSITAKTYRYNAQDLNEDEQ